MKKPAVLWFVLLLLTSASRLPGVREGAAFRARWPERIHGKRPPAAIQLGRMLFYDPVLSADSSISCMSCHLSYTAFAHTDHPTSHGIGDSIGRRNAPALQNLAWSRSYMWDGAVTNPDVLALSPVSHPGEMGETLAHVVLKLQRQQNYRKAFARAYGNETITGERVLKSLSAFMLSLESRNSRYDSAARGEISLNETETAGYALFREHCNKCHTEPLFTSGGFESNGLPAARQPDYGRGAVTGEPADTFRFRVPALRNLRYSAPYMHDGRFRKLRDVLRHYASTDKQTRNLSPLLQKPVRLSAEDETRLLAFLLCLNDPGFVTNKAYGPARNEPPD